MRENKSHLTAIHRKGPSVPCAWLVRSGLVKGHVLDWGCGRGADADFLRSELFHVFDYDPHFQSVLPPTGDKFDTVLCTYVLNVIPDYFARAQVVTDILPYMERGAWLYVAIRAREEELQGYTKRGTWQGYVGDQLRTGGFTLIRGVADYEIWGWQNG